MVQSGLSIIGDHLCVTLTFFFFTNVKKPCGGIVLFAVYHPVKQKAKSFFHPFAASSQSESWG